MGAPKRGLRRRKPRTRQGLHDPGYYTKAGPVTIRLADGTVETRPPLDRATYAEVIKERWAISPKTRGAISKRDRGRCRYCGSVDSLVIDHVVPVAMGGSNRMSNLVLACTPCNTKKGAQVWKPRPLRP